MNNVSLIGRLTKDVELRYTPSGVAITRFTLAVNRQFKKEGEQQADFINIVVWRKAAENVANFLRKGSLAGVEGRIQTGSYTNNENKKVFTTEILANSVQFLESKSEGQQQSQQRAPQQQNRVEGPFSDKQPNVNYDVQDDDDLPF